MEAKSDYEPTTMLLQLILAFLLLIIWSSSPLDLVVLGQHQSGSPLLLTPEETCFQARIDRRACHDALTEATPHDRYTCTALENLHRCTQDILIAAGCTYGLERQAFDLQERALLRSLFPGGRGCGVFAGVPEDALEVLSRGNCTLRLFAEAGYQSGLCVMFEVVSAVGVCSSLRGVKAFCVEPEIAG